ncbi:MAG: hypothetical protein KAV87_19335, partial [Desulfobacteraceae bacterium]|nr:hypothetical protein [Desulfobacteraceae bacterium]
WRGHVGPNLDVDRGLRSQSEIDAWKERCPIGRLGEALEKDNILSEEARLLLYEEVKEEVEKAIAYAQESAFPSPESVTSRIYR